jgi:transposase
MGSGKYDRAIFKQLEETIAAVEKIQGEMTEMKATHRREIYLLNEKHEKTIKELKANQRKEIELLKETITEQGKEINKLKEENSVLREIINKNSGNSSKPPSSDGFKKIANGRERTGKKAGGQRGHKGHKVRFYAKPTKIIEMKKQKCECGGKIEYIDGSYTKKQLVDVEITTNITEYREYRGICGCCGHAVFNRSPLKDRITYGNKLKSLSNMLSVEGNVSINRIGQMLSELSGGLLKLSEGAICKWNKDLSKLLTPAIQKIKEKLLLSPVLHKDETGIRVDKKLNWFHVLSNDKYSLFYADRKRGKNADMEAGVLPAFKGVLVHDNLKSLYHFNCTHAECNAHILRYLKGIIESKERKWAKDMIELLIRAKRAVQTDLSPPEITEFHQLYDEILENGRLECLRDAKSDYYSDEMKLLRRMKEYKTQHLLFLSDRTVPFDNNQAERDLRMIKAKTKISGCFRSADGDSVFAILKSYTSTLRKNALNIFDALCAAWQANPVLF